MSRREISLFAHTPQILPLFLDQRTRCIGGGGDLGTRDVLGAQRHGGVVQVVVDDVLELHRHVVAVDVQLVVLRMPSPGIRDKTSGSRKADRSLTSRR